MRPILAAQFPDAAGFQMWCLTTAPQPQARGEGNMFLLRSPEVHASEQPSAWHFPGEGAGGYRKVLNNGMWYENQVLKAYATLADARFRWDYLALREGECAIFSKRTTHMPNPLVGEAAALRPVRRCSASLPGASASARLCRRLPKVLASLGQLRAAPNGANLPASASQCALACLATIGRTRARTSSAESRSTGSTASLSRCASPSGRTTALPPSLSPCTTAMSINCPTSPSGCAHGLWAGRTISLTDTSSST